MFKRQFTIVIIIVNLFCFFKSELNADTPSNIYTPRGTLVGDSYDCDELYWTTRMDLDNYYATAYPNATQLKLWGEQYSSSGRYNCHGYAWHMIGDNTINDPVWIGYNDYGNTYKYWQDESYSEVAVQYATMVDYSGDHSATTTGETNIYISKWYLYPLMRHYKTYCPNYGNPIKFLRKNPITPSPFSTIQTAINAAVSGQIVHVDPGVPALTADITVPSGIILKIHSGASVSLSGKYIKCEGSSKIINEGSISPNISVKSGSITIGQYSSINAAVSQAQSGQSIIVASGNYTLTGNISLSSGKILTLLSGANVNFNTCYIDATGGTFNIQNGTFAYLKNGNKYYNLYTSIQSAINNALPDQYVSICSGTFSTDLTMRTNIDVIGSGYSLTTLNGQVNFNGVNNCLLSDMTVNYSIYIDGGNGNQIEDVKAKSLIDIDCGYNHQVLNCQLTNSGNIDVFQSNPTLNNNISNNVRTYGVVGYECDLFMNNNTLTNKEYYALYCICRADANVNDAYFCTNNYYDIYAGSECFVDATDIDNIFSASYPAVFGNVSLPEQCISCQGLAKSNFLSEKEKHANSLNNEISEAEKCYREAMAIYYSVCESLQADRARDERETTLNYTSQYNDVISRLKSIIIQYPNSVYSELAVKNIVFCYGALNQVSSAETFLDDALKSKYSNINQTALSAKIPILIQDHQYSAVLTALDNLMNTSQDAEKKIAYFYRKGVIYEKYLKDKDKAAEIYQVIITNFTDTPMASIAAVRLADMGIDFNENQESKIEKKQFNAHNHPNPFNPTTTLLFRLPKQGEVTLKIYDIRGCEVKSIYENVAFSAGEHAKVWDGKDNHGTNVASGMYFYKIEFENMILTQKMLLLR